MPRDQPPAGRSATRASSRMSHRVSSLSVSTWSFSPRVTRWPTHLADRYLHHLTGRQRGGARPGHPWSRGGHNRSVTMRNRAAIHRTIRHTESPFCLDTTTFSATIRDQPKPARCRSESAGSGFKSQVAYSRNPSTGNALARSWGFVREGRNGPVVTWWSHQSREAASPGASSDVRSWSTAAS